MGLSVLQSQYIPRLVARSGQNRPQECDDPHTLQFSSCIKRSQTSCMTSALLLQWPSPASQVPWHAFYSLAAEGTCLARYGG